MSAESDETMIRTFFISFARREKYIFARFLAATMTRVDIDSRKSRRLIFVVLSTHTEDLKDLHTNEERNIYTMFLLLFSFPINCHLITARVWHFIALLRVDNKNSISPTTLTSHFFLLTFIFNTFLMMSTHFFMRTRTLLTFIESILKFTGSSLAIKSL